jgi:hypothetical protein
MSLSDVENALKDAEALKYYDPLKVKNADLTEENKRLKTEKSETRIRYEDRIKSLENIIAEKDKTRITYKKEHYTPKDFDKLVTSKLEKEYRASINKEVNERWAAEAPGMVKEATKKEILSYPKSCNPETRTVIESQGAKHAENIFRYRYTWPPWFQTIYQQEVNLGVQKGLDKAFWDNVNQRATEEINRRVNYEWPKFISEKVTPRFQGTLIDQLKRLNQTIQINCDKCGSRYNVDIGPDTIAALIKEPWVSIKCLDPSCKDLRILPHSFPLTLGYVICYITSLKSKDNSNFNFF